MTFVHIGNKVSLFRYVLANSGLGKVNPGVQAEDVIFQKSGHLITLFFFFFFNLRASNFGRHERYGNLEKSNTDMTSLTCSGSAVVSIFDEI